MKINYNNTALSFLENPKDFPMHTPDEYNKPMTGEEDLKLMYGMIYQFSEPSFSDHFRKNIQYVTRPFYDAFSRSRNKLKEIVLKTPLDDSGTLIFQWPHHTQTIFYKIKCDGNGSTDGLEAFIVMFTKTPRNDSFALDVSIWLTKVEHEIMDIVWKGFVDDGRDLAWWVSEIMLFKTFLTYAEVENKIVNAKRREHHLGVKYVNETNQKVNVLDSTYFTTISRTEGFGVKGHFRLQPYGPGLTQKRLQWIADYQKSGYTRKAKVLREEIK
jgi:hypothetical protein